MRRRYYFTIILLLVVVAVFACYTLTKVDTETAVYSVVLKELASKIPIDEFSFYNHPSTCRGARNSSLPSVPIQVFASFIHNNNYISGRPGSLKTLSTQYHIVSQNDSERIFSGKEPLLQNTQKSLINLSHVGFSDDKTLALLCVESQESGDLVYLSREKKKWKIRQWQYSW